MEKYTYREQKEHQEFISKKIVIKIGSSTITDGKEFPDREFIGQIAAQIATLKNAGVDVYVVSSGAVACGRTFVQDYDSENIAHRQLAAAIGQPLLMTYWTEEFSPYGIIPAQILVTDQTLKQAHTLLRQMQPHHVPIINANDTVSDFEMRQWMQISGDNDVLAGQVSVETGADTTFLLTDVNGIQNRYGEIIDRIDPHLPLHDVIFNGTSSSGTGGMASKHSVASHLAMSGIRTVIGSGRTSDILIRGAMGEQVGTTYYSNSDSSIT